MQRRDILKTMGAGPLALAFPAARSQTFPERPIRIMLPYAAGSTVENALREVAERFVINTGQPLVLEAKPGGAGIVAAMAVKAAAPDGYTLLANHTTMYTINPHTRTNLPYDPDKDFRPVTNLLGASMVMAVNSSVPASTLAEFIKWAKANPGKISFASFSAGNSSHFAGVILNEQAGIDMLHVAYTGTPPAVTALLSNTVQVAFLPMIAVKPHMETGKVKLLAITTPKRSAHISDVPTFSELGYPDLEIYIWAGLVAPFKTPDAIVNRLNQEFTKILVSKELKDKWFVRDFEPLLGTPSQFAAFYHSESKRWAHAVKLSGFKATD